MASNFIQNVYKTIEYSPVIRSSKHNSTFMFILYSEFQIRNGHHFFTFRNAFRAFLWANSSITPEKSSNFALSLLMFKIANPFKSSCTIVDRKYDLIRLRTLKLLSLEATVAGNDRKMPNAMRTFGKTLPNLKFNI